MASTTVFPQMDRLVIMDPKAPCMVKLCEPKVVSDTAMLSTICLEKPLKKKKPRHEMFMVAMIKDQSKPMPMDVSLLDEKKGVLIKRGSHWSNMFHNVGSSVLATYYHGSLVMTMCMQYWKERIDLAREYLFQAQTHMKVEVD